YRSPVIAAISLRDLRLHWMNLASSTLLGHFSVLLLTGMNRRTGCSRSAPSTAQSFQGIEVFQRRCTIVVSRHPTRREQDDHGQRVRWNGIPRPAFGTASCFGGDGCARRGAAPRPRANRATGGKRTDHLLLRRR